MSEINYNPICPHCGEMNDADAIFCHVCGGRISGKAKKKKQPLAPVTADAAAIDAPLWYRVLHNPVIYNGVVALICLTLLLLTLAPFIRTNTRAAKGTYATSFTPGDMVRYTIVSASSYDDVEILKTPEYKEYRRLMSKSGVNSNKPVSASRADILDDYNKASITVGLMRAGSAPTVGLVISALMSVAYYIILICALILSLIAFIGALSGKRDKLLRGKRASRLLGFTAIYMPVYILMLAQGAHFRAGLAAPGFGNAGTALGWGLIASLVILSVVPVYVGIRCYANLTGFVGFKVKIEDKVRLVAMIALLLAAVMIFLPCVSVDFISGYGKSMREKTETVALSEMYFLTFEDRQYYTSMYSASASDNLVKVADSVAKGKTEMIGIGAEVLHGVLNSYVNLSVLYLCATAAAVIYLVLLLALLKRMLEWLMTGRRIQGASKYLGWMIVAASVYFGISVAIGITANALLGIKTYYSLDFGSCFAPFAALLLAIGATVLLNLRNLGRVAKGYDNPDTSSAPYVIRSK